jgi:hypothetical protein
LDRGTNRFFITPLWAWEIDLDTLEWSRMANNTRTLGPKSFMGLVAAGTALCASACSGPDHLTEPLVAEGGTYFDSLGGLPGNTTTPLDGNQGAGGNSSGLGGAANGGSPPATPITPFEWGSSSYDANGGDNVAYQTGHYPGMTCLMSCHEHTMTFGGTAYQPNGTSAAANAQIGLLVNGNLTTTYSGSAGNFFATVSGTVDWATAQIGIRTSTGTLGMPVNTSANGNCNSCHGASNRIVVP